jgi:uncharacterized membrane protein YbaN (DUF454 family)
VGLGFIGAFFTPAAHNPIFASRRILFMRSDPKYKDWLMEHRIFWRVSPQLPGKTGNDQTP